MRGVQRSADLVLKAHHVTPVCRGISREDLEGCELSARFHMIGEADERAPDNFKLVAEYSETPEGFHGVQAQVVINRVQGKGYPYFYACIVADEGLKLFNRAQPDEPLPEEVIREEQTEDGVDVIVIRQRTTRTSGYHTKPARSVEILKHALAVARAFASAKR